MDLTTFYGGRAEWRGLDFFTSSVFDGIVLSNMFRGLIVLLAVTSVAMAAAYIAPLEEKPEKFKDVPGCYISEINAVIKVGGIASSINSCKQYKCYEDSVHILTCGVAHVDPPCQLILIQVKTTQIAVLSQFAHSFNHLQNPQVILNCF